MAAMGAMSNMGYNPHQQPSNKMGDNFSGPGAPPGGHKEGGFSIFGDQWNQKQKEKDAASQEFADLFSIADSKIQDRPQEKPLIKFVYN